jgi:site-specific recombinase XerD
MGKGNRERIRPIGTYFILDLTRVIDAMGGHFSRNNFCMTINEQGNSLTPHQLQNCLKLYFQQSNL